MEVGIYEPKTQIKEVAAELKAMNAERLYDAVDAMSTSLVMGFERYLRKFDSETAIPLLVDVCETFIREDAQADILVISLRALSLMMEHVPSSYEAAQPFHQPLMQLSSKVIHKALCTEWHYKHSNNASMIEEGLRVMRFISKDDKTGGLIQYALVGDLLTLCTDPQPLVARQALETLFMMASKVVMPSELEKPTRSVTSGFLSFFKSKKKSSSTRSSDNGKGGRGASGTGGSSSPPGTVAAPEDIVPYADHPTVVQVENVIAPLLVSLVEQYAKSLASIPEHWGLLELALESLGTLIERALICHRPHTARALASPLLPKILFQLIVTTESNVALEPSVRVDRVLLCETTLTLLTNCHRNMMLESLQLPVARQFFRLILEETTDEITTLLEDPFPRAIIATRSTQRRDKDHITSIAALQLFVLACPTVLPDAFGLKPKLVLPVHQWMWEDELRHDNRLMEEQCVSLETSWARLDHKSRITVHLKQLDADLRTMTMSKGAHGGHRNISRHYVPFVYHFADEMALRPVVAVKEAGPCSVDGTTLVWKSEGSATKNSRAAAAATATATTVSLTERQDSTNTTRSSSSNRRGNTKHARSNSPLSTSPPTTATSLPTPVVLNTQQEVPAKHIAIAEEYFSALCLFAKNTSGQMAKQVATCACASMLQLMFLSGASQRFEQLMEKAVLPMCEMFREALISADKATKAVVLTMVGWMLYHPMADPCEFTEGALRCGLLDQLDILSKTTLLVKDKPTRTATLAEKAGTLAGTIVEKIKERRAAQAGGAGTNANVKADTPLGGVFLSGNMLAVQKVLEELRSCRCAKDKGTSSPVGSPKFADKTHESAIKELLHIFNEATDITAYEVFNVGVASALLYYLLGDMTLEELVGENVVYAAGASASTFTRETVSQPELHTGPIDSNRNASSWATMMASGMHAADILAMFVDEKRMRCLIQWAVKYPAGMRRLVTALVANIPLQSHLPLVESVVTFDKVVCKTPLQAHDALCRIAPLIMLCGDAGRRIAAAIKTGNASEAITPTSATTNVPTPSNAAAGRAANGRGDDNTVTPLSSGFAPSNGGADGKQPRSNSLLTLNRVGAANVLREAPNASNIARIAKECCMEGHRLRFIDVYLTTHRCDRCGRNIPGGYNCRICNYDICDDCYTRYTGNVEMIKSIASMERNRVHLCASIGDLERWFRTGSTSSKGTQLAPTSQSSLHHLERFTIRVQSYLSRYTAVGNNNNSSSASNAILPASLATAAATLPLPASGEKGSTAAAAHNGNSGKFGASFLSFAEPFNTAAGGTTAEVAEKLLGNPAVVRRLTYRYLSRFATRGVLNDEGTAITPAQAEAMDAEVAQVLATEAELHVAEELVQEGVEERYLLYRTSCGLLPLQETVLSTLYRRAFALGDHDVLLQLENCLMRLDSVGEEPLMLQRNGEVTMSNPAASSRKRNPNVVVTKKSKAGSVSSVAAERPGLTVMTSSEKSTEAREFERHRVAMDQTYLFHHFENDAASFCACGAHSRAEFHTEEPPALAFTAPDLASRTDMLLLILLYRVLFEEARGPAKYATETRDIFGEDAASIFENNTITTAVVRSLEASALRVSMLPPQYALPRWVNFLLREGRFLIPLPVRARVARFLAYGARRSFTRHMRVFRNQRNDCAVAILPGEWARMSNHKYTIDRSAFVRDAYVMLRKCADARFPISFEFKGDVGVGQGPTAQFYTLLAAETSKAHAELWRVNGDKQTTSSSGGGPTTPAHTSTGTHIPVPLARSGSNSGGSAHVGSTVTQGLPPASPPTRRSSVTPTSSPPRSNFSRPASITSRSIVNSNSSAVVGPPSSEVTPRPTTTQAVHHVTPTVRASTSGSFASVSAQSAANDTYLVPPSEGFYPRPLDGVTRYADDMDSVPCTPLTRRSHPAHEELSMSTLASQSSGHISLTLSRAADGSFNAAANNNNSNNNNGRSSNAVATAAHYDVAKAALLVDSNVGLMRDFVVEQRERVRAYYVVGAALGRAFLDEQIFPLPLSPALAYFLQQRFPAYQFVLSDATRIDPAPEFPIDVFELPMSAVSWVDQSVAQSLASLSKLDSATLAALELPFTLPGDDSFELLPGGAKMTVSKKNLRQYQRRVVGALLYESVAVPLYFLTMGCRDVVPYEALQVMDIEELIGMLCGEDKNPREPLWTTEEIRAVLVGDHGYQNDSPQLESLAKVLGARLTPSEQRDFLLFCTGCPRLPVGGIRALGAITVVKRSNAFAEARNAAVRAGASTVAEATNEHGGQPELDVEDDEERRPLPGMYERTALSDQEDSSTAVQESPRPDLVSTGPALSEEASGATGVVFPELPDSEWALPSVNTCFRYLKLPPYPTEDLLYKKLLQSITQTGGTFELS
ncbi:HECT-domain (ubiquitin-transferase) [Lotmaria passim]